MVKILPAQRAQKNAVARTYYVDPTAAPNTLIVKTNGGTVTVEAQLDTDADEWVTDAVIDTDGVSKIEANGCIVRFTPAGGAEFTFVKP